MKSDNWFIIVNPASGSNKGEKDWPIIRALLDSEGISYEFVFTNKKEHAIEIVKEQTARGFCRFVSAGGDGTLNETINGAILQRNIPHNQIVIGIIPIGTGNDWSRMFGIPTDYSEAIQCIKKMHTTMHDIGFVKYSDSGSQLRYFINMAGMGFDSKVIEQIAARNPKRKGKLVYITSLLRSLIAHKNQKIQINIDDKLYTESVFSMNLGICRYSGGGMLQAPKALHDDELYDITVMKDLKKLEILFNLPKLYNGNLLKHRKIDGFRGKEILIESDEPLRLEVDGELLGYAPFAFGLLPRYLKLVIAE